MMGPELWVLLGLAGVAALVFATMGDDDDDDTRQLVSVDEATNSFFQAESDFAADTPVEVTGRDADSTIVTGGGDDVIYGGGSTASSGEEVPEDPTVLFSFGNQLLSGDGNDTLYGGDGVNVFIPGAGDDIVYGGNDADQFTDLGFTYEQLQLWNNPDEVTPSEAAVLILELFAPDAEPAHDDDVFYGGAGNDNAHNLWGSDTLYGGAGDDSMWGVDFGANTPDMLVGGSGEDYLKGDNGDTLSGGAGLDLFSVYYDVLPETVDDAITITDYDARPEDIFATQEEILIEIDQSARNDALERGHVFVQVGDNVHVGLNLPDTEAELDVLLAIVENTTVEAMRMASNLDRISILH